MEYKITKKRILDAASKNEDVKEALKTLFPEAFKEEEFWELKTKENKEIYFVNNLTEQIFSIGDKITIKDSNFRFGDGVRIHRISGFSFSIHKKIKKTIFKPSEVYVNFKGYDIERSLTLDKIIKL